VFRQSNQRVIAQMLLDAGANPNAQNVCCPLVLTCCAVVICISLLTQAEGQTALHYCFKYEFSQLANTLIAYGADDTLPNKFMLTPYEGLTLSDLDDF
jgi:hypothetical protein